LVIYSPSIDLVMYSFTGSANKLETVVLYGEYACSH
jgi:hypothetical protein